MPYQSFSVADGDVVIAVGSDAQFRALCAVLRLPELAAAPEAATNAARVMHREQVIARLAPAVATWRRDALLQALLEAGVPAGPINTVAEALSDPQALARQMVYRVVSRDGEMVPAVRSPITMNGLAEPNSCAAPRLNEHPHASWSRKPA